MKPKYDFETDYKIWVNVGRPDTFLTWWCQRNGVKVKNVPHDFFKFLIGQTTENLF